MYGLHARERRKLVRTAWPGSTRTAWSGPSLIHSTRRSASSGPTRNQAPLVASCLKRGHIGPSGCRQVEPQQAVMVGPNGAVLASKLRHLVTASLHGQVSTDDVPVLRTQDLTSRALQPGDCDRAPRIAGTERPAGLCSDVSARRSRYERQLESLLLSAARSAQASHPHRSAGLPSGFLPNRYSA